MTVSPTIMKGPILTLFSILPLSAALPGAWETYSTQEKTNFWGLFDFADGETYAPNWFDEENSYTGASFAANSEDPGAFNHALWFFADHHAAEGQFVGNFAESGIQGLEVDVFISEPTKLSYCDLLIGSEASGELKYYFSPFYPGAKFSGSDSDWFLLTPKFNEQWVQMNEQGEYVNAEITPAILSHIVEIGVRFVPTAENTESWTVFLDNFALTPTTGLPIMTTGSSHDQFTITIEQESGTQYGIQTFNRTKSAWEDLAGEVGIHGHGPYLFSRPLLPQGEFYRVLSRAFYTQVSDSN